LRNTFARGAKQTTINTTRLDKLPEQGKEALIGNPLTDSLYQQASVMLLT
jgi:hypothetical protein